MPNPRPSSRRPKALPKPVKRRMWAMTDGGRIVPRSIDYRHCDVAIRLWKWTHEVIPVLVTVTPLAARRKGKPKKRAGDGGAAGGGAST